jgi:hypothetical protein
VACTDRSIRSYLDGEVSLELPTSHAPVSAGAGFPRSSDNRQLSLIGCSRCLRVLRDEEWVHAETVIRELRSFEYEAPPRFAPVLCLTCVLSIQLRRARGERRSAEIRRARVAAASAAVINSPIAGGQA